MIYKEIIYEKKFFNFIVLIFTLSVLLCSCTPIGFIDGKQRTYLISENNIQYNGFEFGNVIDDGKRAIFLNFSSNYEICHMKVEGKLLDKNNNVLYSFDKSINFGNYSKNQSFPISVEASLLLYVIKVSITNVKAYTLYA